ncbi:MAG: transposase [Terriglobales bacterium]
MRSLDRWGQEDSDGGATKSARSAGVLPAVSGATRPRFGSVTIRDRGHLPHWEKDAATYFVSFRLADSMPRAVLERILSERESIPKTATWLGRELSPDEHKRIKKLSTKKIEEYLDRGSGACHLKNALVAEIVAHTLRHFDEKRYRLLAWCVMPNHVHVVAHLFPGHTLASVVHSWKSFTAKKANGILHSRGAFWQREYYDRLIRDEEELDRSMRYVAENPQKARLGNWPWVWVWGQDAPTTAAGDGGATKPGGAA